MSAKKQNLTLEQRVLDYIYKNRIIEAGQKVLAAVSGGPDSVCLLHILYKLQAELKISLYVAHLNHQLRGKESEADALYVEDLAQKLDIPATIEKRDVSAYQAEHHLSPEEAAREVRYSFLAQVARAVGADRVAVGHTANDQAETILLHIIRGTGTRGLRGLQPCHTMRFSGRELTVVRPLLGVKRGETEDYCSRLRLTPCLDTSNLSLSLLRNRVRRELIPLLQDYNPGVLDSLLRLGRVAGDDLAFLDAETRRIWGEVVKEEEKVFIFAKEKLKGISPALQRHLLRKAIDLLLGTLKDIETRHIEEMLEAMDKPAGRKIILPEGLVFSTEYDRYLLGFHTEDLAPFPELKGTYEIKVPGKTEIPGWEIEASITNNQDTRYKQISNYKYQISNKSQITNSTDQNKFDIAQEQTDRFTACFDFAKTGSRIKLRAREKGDRFQPLGMDQPKKLGEFMLDARIPRSWRGKIPIFCSAEQMIWVAGWRIDERVKVTEKTREILCLRVSHYVNNARKKR